MTDSENMKICGLEAGPGERAYGSFVLIELADGAKVEVPIVLANGARPGPRLYLGAAIHGDEVGGVGIVGNVITDLNLEALSGQILCVPVQQPLALYSDHRIPLAPFLKSPLDQAPADAWLCFPGDRGGNLAERLAAHLFGLITQCNYAIDIHTPTRGGRYVPIAILPHPSLEGFAQSEALADALEPGFVTYNREGIYVRDGVLCVEATRAGVPCFTFELGEGGRLEREVVATGYRCVMNALQGLGMLDVPRHAPERTYRITEFLGLRAQRGGLLLTHATLGQEVDEGDVLCTIVNIFGEEVERTVAPRPGVFVRSTTLSTVATGDRVATLGLLE